MEDNFNFKFPAVRGQQSQRLFYMASVPWRMLSRLFDFDKGSVLERSQRETNPARAKAILRYIKRNSESFVLPPLVGTLDGEGVKFERMDEHGAVGHLHTPMDTKIKLLDGQHRLTAMIAVLKEMPHLSQENIPVQLFTNMSLADRQQAFSDINSNAKPVSRSLNLAYNHRDDALAKIGEEIGKVRAWEGRIDMERNTANPKQGLLFSYKHAVAASVILLGLKKGEALDDIRAMKVSSWWNAISPAVGWDAEAIDTNKIPNTAVGLMALARLGNKVLQINQVNKDVCGLSVAQPLFDVDWSKDADIWQDVLVAEGKMIVGQQAETAAAEFLAEIAKLQEPGLKCVNG